MMNCNPRKLLCFTLFSLLGILTIFIVESFAAAPMNENEISHLRQSVQALNQICQQASLELDKANTAGNFSVQERHDYQTFIAYLGNRISTSSRSPKRDTLSADDDIVARQLREAAEKETDPELKKKLWEEYRKYKAGK